MTARNLATGAFLLEALIAALVLALAALGFLGLTAVATTATSDARWRSEAAALAASTFARMSVTSPATLAAEYDSLRGGAGYRAFAALAQRLPGVTSTANAPEIVVSQRSGETWLTVALRLRWQSPGESTAHRYDLDDAVIAW